MNAPALASPSPSPSPPPPPGPADHVPALVLLGEQECQESPRPRPALGLGNEQNHLHTTHRKTGCATTMPPKVTVVDSGSDTDFSDSDEFTENLLQRLARETNLHDDYKFGLGGDELPDQLDVHSPPIGVDEPSEFDLRDIPELEDPVSSLRRDAAVALYNQCQEDEVDLRVLRSLLDAGADPNRAVEDFAPLHALAAGRHTQAIKLLLQHGAEVNQAARDGHTALGVALDRSLEDGDVECANFLMDNGAVFPDEDRMKFLQIACDQGVANVVDLLVTAENVDHLVDQGVTLLFRVCYHNEGQVAQVVLFLMEHRANPLFETPHGTPYDVSKKRAPDARKIIERYLASEKLCDNCGKSGGVRGLSVLQDLHTHAPTQPRQPVDNAVWPLQRSVVLLTPMRGNVTRVLCLLLV